MRGKLATVTVVTTVLAACSSTGSPATTPAAVPTTAPITTSVSPTTTAAAAPATTVDRTAEIEAIFQDLEARRLRALYDGDREAFRALFANDEYLERSMGLFDLIEFVGPPDSGRVKILGILYDGSDCLVGRIETAYGGVLADGGTDSKVVVLQPARNDWGISYVGEGWACDGPHPLSP